MRGQLEPFCREKAYLAKNEFHDNIAYSFQRLKRQHSWQTRSTAPAMKSDNIMSCGLQQNLHHNTRLE